MAWIKDLTGSLGELAGTIINVPIQIAGELLDSDFIKEVGDGACKVTKRTGELLGDVTEGVVDVVSGTMNSDKKRQTAGVEKIAETGLAYGKGMLNGTSHMIKNGINTIDAILDGDIDKAKKVGKEMAKATLIGITSIGILDIIDGIGDIDDSIIDDVDEIEDIPDFDVIKETEFLDDVDDFDDVESSEVVLIENENIHYVEPFKRELSDGREIWVDGDGDTSVDRDTGWYQTNPDYRVTK